MADDQNTERPHLDRGRTPRQRPLQPGEKQPAHSSPQEVAQGTVDALNQMREDLNVETYGPSSERAKQPGNLNPIPPHERSASQTGSATTTPAQIAAGHLAAATTAIETHQRTEQLLNSDPRRERDQKVYELGQTGKLGLVPPSEAEVKAMAERSGLSEEVADALPGSVEEQVADDMNRLHQAEERAQEGVTGTAATPAGAPKPISGGVTSGNITTKDQTPPNENRSTNAVTREATRPSAVRPGEQEMGTPPNNLQHAVDAGKQVGGAEGRAQARENADREAAEETKNTGGSVIR